MKQLFTLQEVKNILQDIYETYDIQDSEKFTSRYLSNFQDAPPDSAYEKALEEDIESYLY